MLLMIGILMAISVVGVYKIYSHVNDAKNSQIIANEIAALFSAANVMENQGVDDDFFLGPDTLSGYGAYGFLAKETTPMSHPKKIVKMGKRNHDNIFTLIIYDTEKNKALFNTIAELVKKADISCRQANESNNDSYFICHFIKDLQ